MIPEHVISLRGTIWWPPCSPGVAPCNVFSIRLSQVQDKMYQHFPPNGRRSQGNECVVKAAYIAL